MENTLEAIIGLGGLLLGGGGGAFFTWRYVRKKAKAEAVAAEVDAAKDMQELYKKMLTDANEYLEDARTKVDGLRQERDHYKQDRNELREQIEKMQKEIYDLTAGQAKLTNTVEAMRPFICGDLTCKKRKLMAIATEKENHIQSQNASNRGTLTGNEERTSAVKN